MMRCFGQCARIAALFPFGLQSCCKLTLGIVYTQANEMCDYPAGRRFQPLTLALDNLTDCGTGTCAMHRCTSRQLACGLGLQR